MKRAGLGVLAFLSLCIAVWAQAPAERWVPLAKDPDFHPEPPHRTESVDNPPKVVTRPAGARLQVPPGFRVETFAEGLDNPRNLAVAPNGDLFVAESRANRLRVLRPAANYSRPAVNRVFISGLRQPFGIAFAKGYLYIGNTDEVVRVPYRSGQLSSTARPEHITGLPGGGYNQHWTRNLLIDPRRGKLYVTVGSRTNASPEPPPRASILEMNLDGTGRRVLASGLRNPVGLALNPVSRNLWTAVNERDRLGDDVPPDYLTSIRPGGFYGWPYAYLGTHPDPRWGPIRPDKVRSSLMPDVPLPAHSAALGLLFYTGSQFPAAYRGDAYVALHGSWNRRRRSGYRVTRVHFQGGRPIGAPQDFLVGWATSEGEVWGRPVGLAQLKDGSLVVSDDGANKL